MSASEIAVWSSMLGGLLTLAAISLSELVWDRRRGVWRNSIFVLFAGIACVLLTHLGDALWPNLFDAAWAQGLISGIPPIAAGVALYFLGQWLGGHQEDPTTHRITLYGGSASVAAGLVLGLLAFNSEPEAVDTWLYTACAVNVGAAVLGWVSAVRAAMHGDPLARWMSLACTALVISCSGLGLKATRMVNAGLWLWILTTAATLVFFLSTSLLVILRNREQHRLRRLADLQAGADVASGLPTGSALLDEIGHAFWRAARARQNCTVVFLDIRNLYALSAIQGHVVAQQIQLAVAARLRRAGGVRSIVGLYQPRCYILVILGQRNRQSVPALLQRLQQTMERPFHVPDRDRHELTFRPQMAWGSVTVERPAEAQAVDVIQEAERRALMSANLGTVPVPPTGQDSIATVPAPFV